MTIFVSSKVPFAKFWSEKCSYKSFSGNRVICKCYYKFIKIGVIINLLIFTSKYLCLSLFLIKLQDWRPVILLKKRPLHRCFPVNITKCLKKAFFVQYLWWMLLKMVEEFLRISKASLTWNDLHDLTNLNVSLWQIAKWSPLSAIKLAW